MSIVEKLGFTPGPWEKDYGGTDGHIKQIHGRTDGNTPTIAKYDIMKRYDFKECQLIPDNEIEANGHLIAVAPEMLEALIMVRSCGKDERMSNEYLDNIIQKADPQHRPWEEIKELI